MTILKHELKQDRKSLAVWTILIAGMLMIAMIIYPDMANGMGNIDDIFSNMGDFTAAFGMDKLSFSTAMGFYAVEAGNILGIGGGFFAAYIGISILSKEERNGTAEFLLTHPVKRTRVLMEKLLAMLIEIIILNVVVVIFSVASFIIIGEKIEVKEFVLFHIAYLILQIEIGCICFGISAFLRRGSAGVGLGLAAIFYFMNIIKNISEKADFLKYITPFAYAEASEIINSGELNIELIGIGALFSIVALIIGFIKYSKKDIYV